MGHEQVYVRTTAALAEMRGRMDGWMRRTPVLTFTEINVKPGETNGDLATSGRKAWNPTADAEPRWNVPKYRAMSLVVRPNGADEHGKRHIVRAECVRVVDADVADVAPEVAR